MAAWNARAVWSEVPPDKGVAAAVVDQLRRYFEDPAWRFDLPMAPEGTPFQQRVWAALRLIPPGEAISYGALAARLKTAAGWQASG